MSEGEVKETNEEVKEQARPERDMSDMWDLKLSAPAHEQMDIEPAEAGRSLLHDEFGFNKAGPAPRKDIPEMTDISNEPVHIKASEPVDGFVPPKSNFVSVGQVENTWFNDRVAEKVPGPQDMVDNNDDVDIDAVQGVDPLQTADGAVLRQKQKFTNLLKRVIKAVKNNLSKIETTQELKEFKDTVTSKNGVLGSLLLQFKSMTKEERTACSEAVNGFIGELNLEFDAKHYELTHDHSEVEETGEPWEAEYTDDTDDTDDVDDTDTSEGYSIEEGSFLILVDDKPYSIVRTEDKVKAALSDLVFSHEVELSRVKVLKRIPVDFGIVLG